MKKREKRATVSVTVLFNLKCWTRPLTSPFTFNFSRPWLPNSGPPFLPENPNLCHGLVLLRQTFCCLIN